MSLKGEDFVDGQVLLVNKPLNWTSFDVVNFIRSFLRKIFHLKKLKVGHAGTLDPLATGLLIICTGRKTKQIESFQGMDKVYIGKLKLGASTPSFDLETEPDHFYPYDHITIDELQKTTRKFIGEIQQIPPIYSAVKIEGKRAFDYARKNAEVKLKSRIVNVDEFSLINVDLPDIEFMVRCSKGTYIRSLVNDFGKSLNNGAYLAELCRTQIGTYKLSDALTIEEFKSKILNEKEEPGRNHQLA